jgi:hypothetical protein
MNINFETLEITDGTHTMQLDIRKTNDPRFTSAFFSMDPFGNGKVGKTVDPAIVPSLLERAAVEIFPKFVDFENSKTASNYDGNLFSELQNIRWAV